MNVLKPNSIVRLLPSLTDVAFLMPVIFLFVQLDGARTLLGDGDTGWHVRTGAWILQNGRVPDQDIFSFTKASQPWFAWEWLWDLTFGWIHQELGMQGVVLGSILILALTSALLFQLILRKTSNRFIALGVTTFAMAGSSIHWLARPHLFSMLFVVIYYGILDRIYEGDKRVLPLVPLLMILWTNLHGGFFIGLIMIGCYFAGDLIAWAVEADRGLAQAALRRSRTFLTLGVLSFLATFVNPYSYHLHLHIIRFLSGSFNLRFISEYQPLNFQNPVALYFEPFFFLGMVAAAWNIRQKRFVYVLSIAGWAHLALFSARNVPQFLLIAAPGIASTLESLISLLRKAPVADWIRKAVTQVEQSASEFAAIDRLPRVHLASAAVLILLAIPFYTSARPPKFWADYDPKRYPAKAIEVLRCAAWAQHIFTDDEWGDYLIYHLYPDRKVFVDGRFDMYGTAFNEKYMDVMAVKYDWAQNLDRYGVDAILLPVDAPLAGALKESRRWKPVFDDGVAIVFRSAAPVAITVASSSQREQKDSADHRDSGKTVDERSVQTKGNDLTDAKPQQKRS